MVIIMRINTVRILIRNVILNVLVYGSMINKIVINVYVDYKMFHVRHKF